MNALIVHPHSTDGKVALLAHLLERLHHAVQYVDNLDELSKQASSGTNPAIVVIPNLPPLTTTPRQIAGLAETLNRHFFVYVSDDISSDDYKALIRSGSAEWVTWKSAVTELADITRRRGEQNGAKSGAAAGPPHAVVSFVGTVGGGGNTTLAMETGIALASGKAGERMKVALVDLDFQRSVVCDYLDVQPRLDLQELLHNPERLDEYLLDIFTTKHPSGLDIFAAPPSNIALDSVQPTVVYALLDQLFERYPLVLLDVPAMWMPWTGAIISNSDEVVVTGRYSVPAIKQIVYNLRGLEELKVSKERTLVVVNHCERKLIGGVARNQEMDGALTGFRVEYVQADVPFATECVNTGESMLQKSPVRGVCRDIKRVAKLVSAVTPRSHAAVAKAS
ncbi:AAA family ATPase [Alsobacter sp. SYSU M60028]|uniref:AAA family ATPase n=1 Tax=Alsobacter ponti TaxID=2962936 RepID=A0ABT1L8Q4_9HYPH|nr:AAA family ATPase [Alsobacter ponti]MCP8937859.1 AAA family ATPase [Alsobacter ponti]